MIYVTLNTSDTKLVDRNEGDNSRIPFLAQLANHGGHIHSVDGYSINLTRLSSGAIVYFEKDGYAVAMCVVCGSSISATPMWDRLVIEAEHRRIIVPQATQPTSTPWLGVLLYPNANPDDVHKINSLAQCMASEVMKQLAPLS